MGLHRWYHTNREVKEQSGCSKNEPLRPSLASTFAHDSQIQSVFQKVVSTSVAGQRKRNQSEINQKTSSIHAS